MRIYFEREEAKKCAVFKYHVKYQVRMAFLSTSASTAVTQQKEMKGKAKEEFASTKVKFFDMLTNKFEYMLASLSL